MMMTLGVSSIEWNSHTRHEILTHPMTKHVLTFVPHNETRRRSDPPDDCLEVTVHLHRRNKRLLQYLRVPLPDTALRRVAFINTSRVPLDINMFENHTTEEVRGRFCA